MVFNYQRLRKEWFGIMAGVPTAMPPASARDGALSRRADREGPLTVLKMNFGSRLSTLIESEGSGRKPEAVSRNPDSPC